MCHVSLIVWLNLFYRCLWRSDNFSFGKTPCIYWLYEIGWSFLWPVSIVKMLPCFIWLMTIVFFWYQFLPFLILSKSYRTHKWHEPDWWKFGDGKSWVIQTQLSFSFWKIPLTLVTGINSRSFLMEVATEYCDFQEFFPIFYSVTSVLKTPITNTHFSGNC